LLSGRPPRKEELRVTPGFRYALVWIVGSLVIVVAALTMISGAYIDGQYVPSNPDAFYHARRILDSVVTGAPVIQFDPRIQFPEGGWLPWPWGFDTAMATIVRWFGPFASETAAAGVLLNLVVVFAPIAVGLVVLLARQLGLSASLAALLTLSFAGLPLVFLQFAVGNVDHHFAELLFSLLTLCAGIAFFRSTSSVLPALALGAVLGTAVAIHNGLFVLQIPVAATALWRWLRGERLPSRPCAYGFAGSLVATTFAACSFSEPWQQGSFEFYLLSWFHFYVAACTALFLAMLASMKPQLSRIALVGLLALAAAVPLLSSVGLGARFVGGQLDYLEGITEALSPYELYALFGAAQSTQLFSWLMWLAMPALLVNGFWAVRSREEGQQFFAIASVFFLVFLQLQYRFGVLGVVSLLATAVLVIKTAAERWPARSRQTAAVGAAVLAIAFIPTKGVWTTAGAPGGNPLYADVYPGLRVLHDACARRPGAVLAAIDNGHWVRYHTQCSVIGNVFLLTEEQARKRLETEALLDSQATRLPIERPDIAYVLVNNELELYVESASAGGDGRGVLRWKSDTLPALTRALLGPEESLPPAYRVLWTAHTVDGAVFGRLLELTGDAPEQ